MQDNVLIKLLRQRNQQGIHELQRKYSSLMLYIIAPILPDPREQEECLSDISMLVWEKIHLYDPNKSKFNTWLTILTRNAAELKMTERAVEGRLYQLKKQQKLKLRRAGYEYE